MGTIYQCLKRDGRYTPPMMTVVHEAESSGEAVRWLENNGGGIFRNLIHNFDCGVAAKGRLMKIKTADLIGPALDWAVGAALKLPVEVCQIFQYGRPNGEHYISIGETDKDGAEVTFEPSEDWSQGGPIIEREKVEIGPTFSGTTWAACYPNKPTSKQCLANGPTPLIAAMRCFVASCLGDEVDVPDELV